MANSLNKVTTKSILDATVATADIAADAITGAKIADDAIDSEHITDGSIDNAHLADDAVGTAEIADDAITSALIADNAVVTAAINADAVTAAKIADDAVGAEHIEQLDADLSFADNVNASFGAGADLKIDHTGTDSVINNATGHFYIQGENQVTIKANNNVEILKSTGDEAMAKFVPDGSVELYHNNSKKIETTSAGVTVMNGGLISTNGSEGYVEVRDERGAEYKAKFKMAGSAPAIVNENTSTSDRTLTIISQTSNERLVIDGLGRVTKPSTPAFFAYHQSADLNYAVTDTLAYPYELFDIGSNYDTSTSTFTAPVAGRYLFSANANANYDSGSNDVPRAYWKVNGANVANHIHLRGSDNTNSSSSDQDGLEQRSQTVIFNLAANDTVKIVVGQNRWDLFGANSFCGYLLG